MDAELLKLFACPACKGSLTLRSAPEALACAGCRRVYPIREGIPVLLIDEASLEA